MDVESLLVSLGVKALKNVLLPFGVRITDTMLIKKTAKARADELRLMADAISEGARDA